MKKSKQVTRTAKEKAAEPPAPAKKPAEPSAPQVSRTDAAPSLVSVEPTSSSAGGGA